MSPLTRIIHEGNGISGKSGKIDWTNIVNTLAGQGLRDFVQAVTPDFLDKNTRSVFDQLLPARRVQHRDVMQYYHSGANCNFETRLGKWSQPEMNSSTSCLAPLHGYHHEIYDNKVKARSKFLSEQKACVKLHC